MPLIRNFSAGHKNREVDTRSDGITDRLPQSMSSIHDQLLFITFQP